MPNHGFLGWAYVTGSVATINSGADGQIAYYNGTGNTVDDTGKLLWDTSANTLQVTGNLDVSGTLYAKTFQSVTVQNTTVAGTTSFGNDVSDKHQFTGSLEISGANSAGTGNALLVESGLVGIGTLSPGTQVQIEGSAPYITLKNDTAENSDGGCESKILFEDHANVTLAQIQGSHDGSSDDTKGDLIFSTHNGSALTEALRVDSAQLASFLGSVALGNASSDVTTVTSQLTASQGATFAAVVDITDTTDASDASGDTGALKVEGGASIAKKLYVGTDLDVAGATTLDGTVTLGDAASDVTTVTSQLTASQGATFAAVVDITDTTDASDASGDTGALKVEGGASIAKKLYVGTDLDVAGAATLGNALADTHFVTGSVYASGSMTFSTDTATFTSANANDPLVSVKNTADDATGAILRLVKDRDDNTQEEDVVGILAFDAAEDDSATLKTGAKIEAVAEDDWSSTVNDCSLVFYTNEGDDELTEAMIIMGSGDVGIGLDDDPATKLDVAGSFRTGVVTLTGTGALTVSTHAGRVLLLGEDGGNANVVLTLPDATGSGAIFEFIVSVAMGGSTTYKIQAPDVDNTIAGQIMYLDEDGTAVTSFPTVSASDTITLNSGTQGGLIGDTLRLIDIAADKWHVSGQMRVSAGANPATPFSADVS